MPLSPAECDRENVPYTLDRFLERGEFPEPFLTEDLIDANRWRMQYVDSLLRVDVLDFEDILNIRAIQFIFELLRERVGSPISYSSLAEDVHVSPNTVKKYIQILEALYIVFRVTPFTHNIARSLLREPKIYFFDTGLVKGNEGIKLENLVATCLLKHVMSRVDYRAENTSLQSLHTKEGREVDFVIAKDQQIEKMIEVNVSDPPASPHLRYFYEKYQRPAVQIVKELKRERMDDGIEVMEVLTFLKSLDL